MMRWSTIDRGRLKWVMISSLSAFLVAYIIDQYYILDKKWYFLLELVR